MDPVTPVANKLVEFTQCELSSPAISVAGRGLTQEQRDQLRDLRTSVSRCTIYENLFQPTLSGSVTLLDTTSLSSLVPLIGIESLKLQFGVFNPRTRGYRWYGGNNQSDQQSSSPLTFRIYNQTNRIPLNAGTEQYTLGLVSPELMTSTEMRISKTYRNVKLEDVIKDVFVNYMRTKKQFRYVETTARPTTLTVPYLSPLEMIKLFMLQGQSTTGASNYLFYETLDGFYFRTLSNLIQESKQGSYRVPRIRRAFGGTQPTRDTDQVLSAEDIDIVSGFDTLYQLSQGFFASATIGVDVLSGKYRLNVSDVTDLRARPALNDRSLYVPEGQASYVNPSANIRVVPTTNISALNRDMVTKDPDIRENFLEQTLDVRSRELLALQSHAVRVRMPGAPDIGVGKVVYIDIPTPLNVNASRPRRDILSGRYLIVAAEHTLINNGTGQFSYETVFEACSDSVLS